MAAADDLAGVYAIGIVVVAQRVEGHEAFDEEIVELDEEAVFGRIENHRVEVFSDAITHELDFFPLDELAFGLCGAALGLAGLLGETTNPGLVCRGR